MTRMQLTTIISGFCLIYSMDGPWVLHFLTMAIFVVAGSIALGETPKL